MFQFPTVANVELEYCIIASAITDEAALSDFAHIAKPEDFSDEKLSKICRELHKVAAKGYKPDVTLIVQRLGMEYLDTFSRLLGGNGHLALATTSNIKDQIRKLKEISLCRRAVSEAAAIVMGANNINDHEDYARASIARFSGLDLSYDGGRLEHVSTAMPEAMKLFKDIASGMEVGIKTGISGIDRQTNGFRAGEYIVIAGRPGEGKTSLGLSIAKNMINYGKKVAFFSLEMSSGELVLKMVSMLSTGFGNEVPSAVFRGTLPLMPKHFSGVEESARYLAGTGLYINDSCRTTFTDIEVELRKFVRTTGADCVIIDYLGLVNDDSGVPRKRHEQIQNFSMRSKRIFKELKIPGVVLVQLSRDAHNKRPSMAELAESGQIERDADMIYLIYTPDTSNPTEKVLICDKGRAVGKRDIPLYFSTSTTEFTGMTEDEERRYHDATRQTPEKEKVAF